MAYYIVTDTQAGNGEKPATQFLVCAKNKAAALAMVVEPRYSVIIADPKDLILLSAAGVKVIEKV